MKLKKSFVTIIILALVFAVAIPVSAKTKVTYSNFLKVKMGMSYSQVKSILGKGKVDSTSTVGGIKSTIYKWGDYDKYMLITVQSGKVIIKMQNNLSSRTSNITKAKYKKIKTGMTYAKVKAILGSGILVSQTKTSTSSTAYNWLNKDGDTIVINFYYGKVSSKIAYGF